MDKKLGKVWGKGPFRLNDFETTAYILEDGMPLLSKTKIFEAIGTRAFMNINQLTLWNVQKWLRDKHHCIVEVTLDVFTNGINWNYQILFYDPKTFEILDESTYKCGDIAYINKSIGIYQISGKWWNYSINGVYSHTINYLHQLQNLYFTLTGKELGINL